MSTVNVGELLARCVCCSRHGGGARERGRRGGWGRGRGPLAAALRGARARLLRVRADRLQRGGARAARQDTDHVSSSIQPSELSHLKYDSAMNK